MSLRGFNVTGWHPVFTVHTRHYSLARQSRSQVLMTFTQQTRKCHWLSSRWWLHYFRYSTVSGLSPSSCSRWSTPRPCSLTRTVCWLATFPPPPSSTSSSSPASTRFRWVYTSYNSSRSECSLRREAIRNALFLQRKVPENPHRKIVNAKLLAPSKTCPNWTNLIYISLASVSKCAVQCGPLWLIVNCGLAPCLIRST